MSILITKVHTVTSDDLDRITREAQREHPGIGLRMLKGYLKSKALRVQWERVRQSLLRTDPTGVHQRCRDSIRRRKYWVPGPLALWQIDGRHKLIRYNLTQNRHLVNILNRLQGWS